MIRINPMPAFVRACTNASAVRRATRPRTLKPRPLKPMTGGQRRRAYSPEGYGWYTPAQFRRLRQKASRLERLSWGKS